MKDLKIDLIDILHNEDKKQEAVWMLNKIGYKTGYKSVDFYRYLYACGNGHEQHQKTIQFGNNAKTFRRSNFKEITLAELRDMVKPMKEYLNKTTYEYKLAHSKPDGEWVCIPELADFYVKSKIIEDNFFFCMDNSGVIETYDTMLKNQWHRETLKTKDLSKNYEILWQRPQQPEALPFIDDNPKSLNNQYAEIEQVRQAIKVKSGSDSDHALDAMSFGIMGLSADANHAQQQTIEATLAERQSTYGNFEDVAFVTENIMSILGRVRVNGLSELPDTHRMALYMIASKMARIVNGDFNHLDSWHDIGGYSKLIEKLIKGE